ncbi:hypothetical protein [Colwellia sp. E150_009]
MKAAQFLDTKTGMVLAIGAVGAVAIYLFNESISNTINNAGQSINPTNQDNIFNQGVLAVGRNITGNEHWTLGGWIYDITHQDQNYWQGTQVK